LNKSQSRSASEYPSTPSSREKASVTLRSKPGSAGSISSSPRQIRSDPPTQKSPASFSSPPAIRSYSPSPRISSSARPSSGVRGYSPRTYSPDARITRYGTTSPLNSTRSSGQFQSYGESRLRGWTPFSSSQSPSRSSPSRFEPTPAPSRSEIYSPLRSYSGSSSRSIFSSPKSVPSSRSFGSSSPSSSVSRSSPRVSSSSRSAPSRSSARVSSSSRSSSSSSSSRSRSSGSVRRKN
jgi:hypothetical protein